MIVETMNVRCPCNMETVKGREDRVLSVILMTDRMRSELFYWVLMEIVTWTNMCCVSLQLIVSGSAFRQCREERSCHARIPSGWKDSFQTNRLRHAPSALHQPQRTPSGSVLHHSMWVSFKPAHLCYWVCDTGISVPYCILLSVAY